MFVYKMYGFKHTPPPFFTTGGALQPSWGTSVEPRILNIFRKMDNFIESKLD
jgi:hypothetical protein